MRSLLLKYFFQVNFVTISRKIIMLQFSNSSLIEIINPYLVQLLYHESKNYNIPIFVQFLCRNNLLIIDATLFVIHELKYCTWEFDYAGD